MQKEGAGKMTRPFAIKPMIPALALIGLAWPALAQDATAPAAPVVEAVVETVAPIVANTKLYIAYPRTNHSVIHASDPMPSRNRSRPAEPSPNAHSPTA